MKHSIIFLSICLLSIYSFSQTKGTAKIYGYKQSVVSGMRKNVINENGQELNNAPKAKYNYWFYIVSPSIVYPSELWINGQAYSAKTEIVFETPVEKQGGIADSSKLVLVPKTTQRVLMLTPAPAIEKKQSEKGKSLASNNELVVVYKQAGKFHYNTIKKLTQLETVAMQ